jgi:hypothetical protein
MIRYGAPAHEMRPHKPQELFFARLALLIIMAKAYLKGYPMGQYRTDAIASNSRFIFYEVIKLSSNSKQPAVDPQQHEQADKIHGLDHLFMQRAQLLSIMCTSIAEGNPLGNFRQQALKDNIDQICGYMAEKPQLSKISFLKVA